MAVDSTLLAAAAAAAAVAGAEVQEEPVEAEPTWGRTLGACWSCDRPTCPSPCPPGWGRGRRRLGSCTESLYQCCGPETNMNKGYISQFPTENLYFDLIL